MHCIPCWLLFSPAAFTFTFYFFISLWQKQIMTALRLKKIIHPFSPLYSTSQAIPTNKVNAYILFVPLSHSLLLSLSLPPTNHSFIFLLSFLCTFHLSGYGMKWTLTLFLTSFTWFWRKWWHYLWHTRKRSRKKS